MSSAPVLQQQRFLLPGDIASTLVSLSQSYGFGTLTRESGLQEALWLALPNWDIGDTDSGVLQLADIELYGDTRLASYLPLSQEGEAQTLSSFFGSGSSTALSVEGTSIAELDNQIVLGLGLKESESGSKVHSLLLNILLDPDAATLSGASFLGLSNQYLEEVHLVSDSSALTAELLTLEELIGSGSGRVTQWPAITTSSADLFQRDYAAGSPEIILDVEEIALLPNPQSGQTSPISYVQTSILRGTTDSGLSSGLDSDVLITAWNADGTIAWEAVAGNNSDEYLPKIATNADGVVVAFAMEGGLGAVNPVSSSADLGIGLVRYDLDGQVRWSRRLGDLSADGGQDVADVLIADDGTILVLGSTFHSDPAVGLHGQQPAGDLDQIADVDAYITAFSPGGDRLWTHQFGSNADDIPQAFGFSSLVRADQSINTLVIAGHQSSVDNASDQRGWLEYLELPVDLRNAPSASVAPSTPRINFAVIDDRNPDQLLLDVQGFSDPDTTISLQLSSDQSPQERLVLSDPVTGQWRIQLPVDSFLQEQRDSDSDLWVLTQAIDTSSGLTSDPVVQPIIDPESTSLSDQQSLEILWIDPDGSANPLEDVPLVRLITSSGASEDTSSGRRYLVDYTGSRNDGFEFDSSTAEGRTPYQITIDQSSVITGWHEGLRDVPIGSTIQLIIPPELAYGNRQEWLIYGTLKQEIIDAYPDLFPNVVERSDYQFGSVNASSQYLAYLQASQQYNSLFDPDSLYVLPNLDPDIPIYSTLRFDIDVRADLTAVDDFLRTTALAGDVSAPDSAAGEPSVISFYDFASQVASDLLNTSRGSSGDILDAAVEFGSVSNSSGNDSILLSQVFQHDQLDVAFLPVMGLGGAGDDELFGTAVNQDAPQGQALILFGESGDDLIGANSSAPYAFLDGGAGNDIFNTSAQQVTYVHGGTGVDTLVLNYLDWELLEIDLRDDSQPIVGIGRLVEADESYLLDNRILLTGVETAIPATSLLIDNPDQQATINFNLFEQLPAQTLVRLASLGQFQFDFSTLSTITGLDREITDLVNSSITLDSQNLVLSDQDGVSVERVIELAELSNGVVTARVSNTTWSELRLLQPLLSDDSQHQLEIGISDDDLNADQFVPFLPLITESNLLSISSITGSLEAVQAIYASPNTVLSTSSDLPSQVITLTDSLYQATDVLDLLGVTSGILIFEDSGSVPLLEGSLADISTIIDDSRVFGLQSADFVLTDSSTLSAQELIELDGFTTGLIEAMAISAIAGDSAQRNQVFNSSSVSLPLNDDAPPELLSIDFPSGIFGPNETLPITLVFSEPVQLQSSSAELHLSDGFTAHWVGVADTVSNRHHFEMETGQLTDVIESIRPIALTTNSLFTDSAGNALEEPGQQVFDAILNPLTLSPLDWSLDVDGNGKVTALGDGLMILRYLFGTAYAGRSLSDQAVDLIHGTRTDHDSIRSYIRQADEQGLLDVDRDNQTLALTDGLMILRHLFGSAFAGSSLVDKAYGIESELLDGLGVINPAKLSTTDKLTFSEQVRSNITSLM